MQAAKYKSDWICLMRADVLQWRKRLAIFVLFFIATTLPAQQVITERVGNKNLISILMPTANMPFKKQSNNDLVIQAIVSSNNKLIHKHTDILRLNPTFHNEEKVFYQFYFENNAGNYDLILKINNRTIGSTTEKDFTIHFTSKVEPTSSFYLIYYKNNTPFIPINGNWQEEADSLQVVFYHQDKPEQVFFAINDSVKIELPNLEYINYIVPDSLRGHKLDQARIIIHYKDRVLIKHFEPFLSRKLLANRYSANEQLQQIRFLMTQNEYKNMKKLKNKQLEDAIYQYWQRHDPTPDTADNEYQETIYNRIIEANSRFTVRGLKEGWKTDFGMVFIKYGEPDDIQSESFITGKYPVVIWYYRSINKTFYFDDKKGYGYYELRKTNEF
mgnify:FL=1